jgi:hypothetical protein
LENARFILDEDLIFNVDSPTDTDHAATILAHLLSPARSGVCDELLALIRMEVLRLDERGIPVLARDWWSGVDLLLLDDMHNHWGVRADPSGKYGIVDDIRKPLAEEWTKTIHGWALTADKSDTIYDSEEFDAWREAFEDKHHAQTDAMDGIGRFGI